MDNRIITCIFLCALAGPVGAQSAYSASAEVFHTAHDKVDVPVETSVLVYVVDAVLILNAELTAQVNKPGLKTPADIAAYAQNQSIQLDTNTINLLVTSYQGLKRASELGITKVPAIVFQEQYVIYGERKFNKAQAMYKRWVETTGVNIHE